MKRFLAILLIALVAPANAAINILASVPEWGALARVIGGPDVVVVDATHGLQDPHHIEARPSLIARARTADLMIATGAELEVGWLPMLQRESGNRRIQRGQPGYFEAASVVTMLEVPARVDRADGDVHAAGNPHIQLDPRNILKVAEAITKRLAEIDPLHADAYRARHAEFAQRWRTRIAQWEVQAAALRGMAVWSHHRSWPYLFAWLGMRDAGALEPKPGVEPTSAHLAALIANRAGVQRVLYATYQSERAARWVTANTGIAAVALPLTVGGTPEAKDLEALFDDILRRLLNAPAAQG